MSVLQVANVHFESSAIARIEGGANNSVRISSGQGGTLIRVANVERVNVGNGTVTVTGNLSVTDKINIISTSPGVIFDAVSTQNGDVSARVYNPSTGNAGTAKFDLSTGVPNTYGIWYLNNGNGNPFSEISLGPGVSGGLNLTTSNNSAHIILKPGGNEALRANTNGRIGIHTPTPLFDFHVAGTSGSSIETLVDGATITANLASNNNFTVVLGGNRTFTNPINGNPGQSGIIYIIQDGTGSRTLAWGSNWRFPSNSAPTLSTAANAVDAVAYFCRSNTSYTAQAILNVG